MAVQQYRVAKGDNLFRIGKKFGIPYQEIIAANQLKSSIIHVNQLLIIPDKKSATSASAPKSGARVVRPASINPGSSLAEPKAAAAEMKPQPASALSPGPVPSLQAFPSHPLPKPQDAVEPGAQKMPSPSALSPSPIEPKAEAAAIKPAEPPLQAFSSQPLPRPRDPMDPIPFARKLTSPSPIEPKAVVKPAEPRPAAFVEAFPSHPLPKPRDPVEPFAIARKLPSPSSLPPSPPLATRADPLGIGQNPASAPYRNSLPPSPPKPLVKAPAPVVQLSSPANTGKGPARYREVPASAKPSHQVSNSYKLDPNQFPTPSFNNAHKPSRVYTVKDGDTIWEVSRKFGVSPLKLRQANNIMFNKLRPGMKLTIPDSHGIWAL